MAAASYTDGAEKELLPGSVKGTCRRHTAWEYIISRNLLSKIDRLHSTSMESVQLVHTPCGKGALDFIQKQFGGLNYSCDRQVCRVGTSNLDDFAYRLIVCQEAGWNGRKCWLQPDTGYSSGDSTDCS